MRDRHAMQKRYSIDYIFEDAFYLILLKLFDFRHHTQGMREILQYQISIFVDDEAVVVFYDV